MRHTYTIRKRSTGWWWRGRPFRSTDSYAEAVATLEKLKGMAEFCGTPLAIYRRRGAATANPWRRMEEPSEYLCPT